MQVPAHKRLVLLRLLLDDERERLQTWAQPLQAGTPHAGAAGPAWREHVQTAWAVNPTIALALLDRYCVCMRTPEHCSTDLLWLCHFIVAGCISKAWPTITH
jgi:hypothetical protein